MKFSTPKRLLCFTFLASCFAFPQAKASTIKGFVRDIRNGETLSYVNVILKGEKYGTVTDKNGYYVIGDLPSGKHVVVFSMMGYQKLMKNITLKLGEVLTLDAFLEPAIIPMRELVVSAERERFKQEVDVGLRRMEIRGLRYTPGFLEQDLLAAIQSLPGIITISDFNNLLYVRGGSPDQNLTLLDDITIYDPYHFYTFFSIFNIDAVKSAELLTGGFPAEYGGRISSVLDIRTRSGNIKKISGKGETSLVSSKLMLEGPISSGSWLVSARRTYIDKAVELFYKDGLPFTTYFYDLYGRIDFDISQNLRIALSGFTSKDIFYTPDQFDYRWGNGTLALKLRYIPNPKLFSTLIFKVNSYNARVFSSEDDEFFNDVNDISLKGDLSYFLSSNRTLKTGFDARVMHLASQGTHRDGPIIIPIGDFDNNGTHSAFYIQSKSKFKESIITNFGIRFNYYVPGEYFRVAPRIGVKYLVRPDLALKCAWGHYYQFVSTPLLNPDLYISIAHNKRVPRMYQFWYPCDEQTEPTRAIHYVLGITKWLTSDLSLDIEGYYKDMQNLLEQADTRSLLNEEFQFNTETGYALGLEVILKRGTNWIDYTYAVTKRTLNNISFYAPYDCRHNFKIAWNFPFKKTYNIGIRWVYRSGLPYTGVVGTYQHMHGWVPRPENYKTHWAARYSERYELRGPLYHRLDIILNKYFKLFKVIDVSLFLQIINLYNRTNFLECTYSFNEDTKKWEKKSSGYRMLPIIPSIGIRAEF